ncbi:toll/interleukin-1 receptor domain-containing protein [Gilvimarinus algae]|uniref:Toll/interleukin-1 receptor domain-containing protein n=1 Tax=Gilvimarinus algae TaxID=3058037 RepID=A0ABT8TMY3_9GAMM|nr:toll/interleukin-1 receptor domain-containing protein [Gilvimarinus sp. SDUM040014]MDO3383757.1 toll/interleukin-1 receptor domain-containing protein [Gilvimarinus sp. SDUM040014]
MKVFISHTSEDAQIAKNIRNYLAHRDIDVFDDKTDISMGSNLASSINEAISSSDAVLFVISKNTEKSRWVHQEMSLALNNKLKGKEVKLIPIVVEKNSEIPFFLKDYLYLDISKGQDFESGMSKIVQSLASDKKTSIQQDLETKVENIEIEKKLLMLKSLEHEEHKKFRSRQMFFITMIATLISSIAASVGLLGWVAKIEYSNFEWVLAFLVGAVASMLGSLLYMRKEQPHKDEVLKKIEEIHATLKDMEARHDK